MTSEPKEVLVWLNEACSLDAKMVLLGWLYDGADLDAADVREVIEEVVSASVVHLINTSTVLHSTLMRDAPYMPPESAKFFARVSQGVDLKPPLTLFSDIQERIGALIACVSLKVSLMNMALFSHVPSGKIPDWDKRFEGTPYGGFCDPE